MATKLPQKCKWCLRDKTSGIPWARRDGDECQPCRGYIRIAWCDRSKEELLEKLEDESSNNRETYNEGLAKYEKDRARSHVLQPRWRSRSSDLPEGDSRAGQKGRPSFWSSGE